jgi:outer membrane immunogenic protein
MKRFVIAGALALAAGGQALAADLPPPMAPPPRAPATYVPAPVPIFSWSGIYIGINGGYSFANSSDSFGGGTLKPTGFLAGATLGGNYQFGNFVVGLEGDGDWSNLDGTTSTTCLPNCETKSTWLATVRGRAGYAWDRVLFFGTAGGAFGNVQSGPIGGPFTSGSQAGWTAGAGIEAAFAPNWTAKVEYLYINFAGLSCSGDGVTTGCGVGNTVTLTDNLVRAGINYKFSW